MFLSCGAISAGALGWCLTPTAGIAALACMSVASPAWRLSILVGRVLLVAAVLLAFANGARAESCVASHYGHGDGFNGRRTASGERFNAGGMTAAHRRLPFGTRVRVTLASGRSVVVRISDRGPFVRGRCIDLAYGASRALGMGGTARVVVEALPR